MSSVVEYQCRMLTLQHRACGRAAITSIGGLAYCPPHFDRLRESIIYELDEERRPIGFTHQIRLAVHRWDNDARAAADEQAHQERQAAKDQVSVYYAERDGYIKIGQAIDVERRMKALALGGVQCPPGMTLGPLTLLATHGGGNAAERAMHRKFAVHRVVGEWFERAPELLEHIEHVALGKHWGRRFDDDDLADDNTARSTAS